MSEPFIRPGDDADEVSGVEPSPFYIGVFSLLQPWWAQVLVGVAIVSLGTGMCICAMNTAFVGDLLQTYLPAAPVCGDGVVADSEACEPGGEPCAEGFACTDACQCEPDVPAPDEDDAAVQLCGNDAVDDGEDCDGADLSACTEDQTCMDCKCVDSCSALEAYCEENPDDCPTEGACLTDDHCAPGNTCAENCSCTAATCSDDSDGCQSDTDCPDGLTCDVDNCDCVTVCGDGVVGDDEECDGSDLGICTANQVCSNDCQCVTQTQGNVCGNGIIEAGEQCDQGGCASGYACQGCTCVTNQNCACEDSNYVCRDASTNVEISNSQNDDRCVTPVCSCEDKDYVCRNPNTKDETSRVAGDDRCQNLACTCEGNDYVCRDAGGNEVTRAVEDLDTCGCECRGPDVYCGTTGYVSTDWGACNCFCEGTTLNCGYNWYSENYPACLAN